jgi:hypothetical protein
MLSLSTLICYLGSEGISNRPVSAAPIELIIGVGYALHCRLFSASNS